MLFLLSRCGQIVCDKCSSNRIRLPVEELIEDPMVSISQYPLLASQSQRVCDTCYREPIRRSSAESSQLQQRGRSSLSSRSRPYDGTYMRRTDSSQSLMIDCPVCGNTFLGMPKNEQEDHLQRCLNVGSPPVQSPRYIGKLI
jgi:protein-arginine kinase activator protein McsA